MSERGAAPVWARTLDVLCLLLAAVAAIVAVSGGFRAHAGGLRLAVTSPLPLILWCVAIAVARHLAAPQQPLYREFPVDDYNPPTCSSRPLTGTRWSTATAATRPAMKSTRC